MRKRNLMVLCSLLVMSVLTGCSRTMQGTEELIEKAREEIPVAEADEIDIQYAGLCGKDELALIWFISGNEYQAHYYLPMECKVVGKDEYTFEHTYKPMDRGEDIAVLQWQGGYCFLINNPDCVAIRLIAGGDTKDIEIEKDAYPYIYYHEMIKDADTITAYASLAYIRISRTHPNDMDVILRFLENGNTMVFDGAVMAMAWDDVVPAEEEMRRVIEILERRKPVYERPFSNPIQQIISAMHKWPKEISLPFLNHYREMPQYAHFVENTLAGKRSSRE